MITIQTLVNLVYDKEQLKAKSLQEAFGIDAAKTINVLCGGKTDENIAQMAVRLAQEGKFEDLVYYAAIGLQRIDNDIANKMNGVKK